VLSNIPQTIPHFLLNIPQQPNFSRPLFPVLLMFCCCFLCLSGPTARTHPNCTHPFKTYACITIFFFCIIFFFFWLLGFSSSFINHLGTRTWFWGFPDWTCFFFLRFFPPPISTLLWYWVFPQTTYLGVFDDFCASIKKKLPFINQFFHTPFPFNQLNSPFEINARWIPSRQSHPFFFNS